MGSNGIWCREVNTHLSLNKGRGRHESDLLSMRMWPNHCVNAQTIGKHIAEARKALGLSQALFARKFNVSPQAVGKWERGESLPDVIMLSKIAELTNMDVCEFLDIKTHKCGCAPTCNS